MDKNELEMLNIKAVKNIVIISRTIRQVYEKISKFEKDDKCDSIGYLNAIDHLSMLVSQEDKYYHQIDSNIVSISIILSALNLDEASLLNGLFDLDYRQIEKRRIAQNLIYFETENMNDLENLILNKIKESNYIDKNDLPEVIKKSVLLKRAMDNDLYGAYLLFLQEEIMNNNNKDIRNDLINAKYSLLYVSKLLERNFIVKQNIESSLTETEDFIKELDNIDKSIFNEVKEDFFKNKAEDQVLEIYKCRDNTINNKINLVLRKCLLKSSLLFVSNYELENMKKFIEGLNLIMVDNQTGSKNVFTSVIENINKDKKLVKKLYNDKN